MHRDRGSASLELVLLTPVFLALLLFVVLGGRYAQARADVGSAARDAARAASIERSPAAAVTAAERAAVAGLDDRDVVCRDLAVDLDTTDFRAGGTVTASVSCVVAVADLVGFGLPATTSLRADFVQPVDSFRGIDP